MKAVNVKSFNMTWKHMIVLGNFARGFFVPANAFVHKYSHSALLYSFFLNNTPQESKIRHKSIA